MGRFSVRSRCDYPPAEWPSGVVGATRRLRSLVRAHALGAQSRISDTRVRNVPELARCVTPLSVANDVTERPVQDRALPVGWACEVVARIMAGSLLSDMAARCRSGVQVE